MKIKILSESPEETQMIASYLANYLTCCYQSRIKKALVISLEGELGSGKTEFMKGVGKALGLKEAIFSPTFLLMKRFPLKKSYFQFLWHLDCYRLQNKEEVKNLDWQNIVAFPRNMIFVEWGDKIRSLLPSSHWTIRFTAQGEQKRLLEFNIPLTRQ